MLRRSFALVAVLAVGMLSGCGDSGPETTPVTGTVTLDGKPLAGATLEFVPEKGRPASAITNEQGEYELKFNVAGKKGAQPGKYQVMITTARDGNTEGGEGGESGPVPEKLPAVYNTETTLEAEIKPGMDPLDFKLESGAGQA